MKQVFVHDTALSPVVLQNVQNYFAEHVRWKFGWPQGVSDPFSHWNIDFLNAPLKSQADVESQLFAKPELQAVADVWRALKEGPMRGHYLLRCYANAHTFGVEGHPHTDIVDASQVDNYTAVVYLNPVWKKEWAGELVLFNPANDTICAVLPQAGRAALIPGDIVHAARGVSRQCPAVRVCVAFKSRLPTAAELATTSAAENETNTKTENTNADAEASYVHFYIDPISRRVAYMSAGNDVPTRIFVYESAGSQSVATNGFAVERIFTSAMLQKVTFQGKLPARMYAQNSWTYKLSADGNALVPAV
jgi:2OG-Fe(II) oxygenase superfamily